MTMISAMADPARLPPSLWAATAAPALELPSLAGEKRANICVIGGGFTGLAASLAAAKAGATVILLEASEPGWGASGRNGGQVIPGFKWDPDDILKAFGPSQGEKIIAFGAASADVVFQLIKDYGIDCAASRRGWLQAVHSRKMIPTVQSRVEQWQARGQPVEFLDASETRRLSGTGAYEGALLDRRGGVLNPLSYARGLARAAISEGVDIYMSSPAVAVERQGQGWLTKTAQGRVVSDKIILCTNGYGRDLLPHLERTVIPVASFIVATKPLSGNVASSILPDGQGTSDTRRLLLYCRKDPAGRLVVGGRGRFADPVSPADFAHVEKATRSLFPQLGSVPFEFRWSGRVAVTVNHFPHVIEPEPGLIGVMGYNGRGVAMASALGGATGTYAANGDAASLPIPLSKTREIPFYGLRRAYVAAASAWYRGLDALNLP
ncbi:glycine/D-amino acid oxidase-like deaminating enzyme [Rhodoligotrophos appendicifer]|uniref:NAD(P)/FAD-dependent oxidoreductase n=1 Tax=Rhodoligotrophos appendicifer TaxID=987056 RepID=UPI0019616767|nr:FAD-binding oxidoreductase [Rhodoligotrophos appendicifer]